MDFSRIELRHLRYFLAVAEQTHFTRAAEKLHVSQPTLSHQIRQLEAQVNFPLFDRVGRRVKLTAAGELLLPHARRAIRALEEAQTALSELHGLQCGELKVGIVQTVNACVIPEIVGRFTLAHPGIRVTCSELSVEEIETGLHSGRLDLGVSFLPASRKGLVGEKLFTEELILVAPKAHALAKSDSVQVRALAAHALVLLSSKYCTRQLIDRAFAEADITPEIQIEMNSVESILATVKSAHLLTLLPSLAMCQAKPGLKSIRLKDPTPRRTVGLLWLDGAHRRVAAEAFAKVTQEALIARKAKLLPTSSI